VACLGALDVKTVLALAAAAVSGAAMAFQGTFNAALGKRVGLVGTSGIVHVTGALLTLVILVAALALRVGRPGQLPSLSAVPLFAYLGGVLSVLIIAGVAFAIPVTGAALGVSVIVTAQLAAALLLDHFGLFELTRVPVTWVRVLGVALLIIGTRLVAK
jgi:transporter family-2 protein